MILARPIRYVLWFLAAIFGSAAVFAGWIAWFATQGPIDLNRLTPYIEEALTSDNTTVRIGDTVLVRDEEGGMFAIRAREIVALSPEGVVIARIPQMSVHLSLLALLRGVVAPSEIALIRPSIRLVKDQDGLVHLGSGAKADESVPAQSTPLLQTVLNDLFSKPGGDGLTDRLTSIDIRGGNLVVEDMALQKIWRIPRIDAELDRSDEGFEVKISLALHENQEPLTFNAALSFADGSDKVRLTGDFAGLRPKDFAELAPELVPLAGIRFSLSGSVQGEGDKSGQLEFLRFQLKTGEGTIIPPGAQEDAGAHIRSIVVKGSIGGMLDAVDLQSLTIDLDQGTINASGRASNLSKAPVLTFDADLGGLPVSDVKKYWPPGVVDPARDWVTSNLFDGVISKGTLKLKAHVAEDSGWDNLEIDLLAATVAAEGVSVQYLAPMPAVRNARATATIDADKIDISIEQGHLMGLSVTSGKAILSGLSDEDQFLDLNIDIKGPLTDALRLIDSQPLGFVSKLGMKPEAVKGEGSVNLTMNFPLLAALTFDEIKIGVKAAASKVGIEKVALGLDMEGGELSMNLDEKGLDLSGKANLSGTPATIKWRENFTSDTAFRSRYIVDAVLDDAARAKVGLNMEPFQPPFMTGPVSANAVATLFRGGKGTVDVKADLKATQMALEGLNWVKAPGSPANATASISLLKEQIAAIPSFTVTSPVGKMSIAGNLAFERGKLRRINFTRAQWARTNITGALIFPAGKPMEINVAGEFDAREILSEAPSQIDPGYKAPPKIVEPDDAPKTPLSISAKLTDLWLKDDGALRGVTMTMQRDTKVWRWMDVKGTIGDRSPVEIAIRPKGDNQRSLALRADDGGELLRTMDIFDNIAGGKLTIDGTFDDSIPKSPLSGIANLSDYRLKKAPFIAKLLTVAALTGALDILSGSGISFSRGIVPFTLTDGVLELKDARTSGAELGMTAKGQIDLDNDRLALEGTVVPAYAINSALGNIPLVGGLFRNEEGGGLVAVNYSAKGTFDDPSITVNPLSALTPGFLRGIFGIFSSGTDVRPAEKTEEPTAETPAEPKAQ